MEKKIIKKYNNLKLLNFYKKYLSHLRNPDMEISKPVFWRCEEALFFKEFVDSNIFFGESETYEIGGADFDHTSRQDLSMKEIARVVEPANTERSFPNPEKRVLKKTIEKKGPFNRSLCHRSSG